MDYYRDVHDWLGGYPYESLRPHDVEAVMKLLGFSKIRSFVRNWFGAQLGLFGSGCDEYVYRKSGPDSPNQVSTIENTNRWILLG
jgi:hypothetical protein